MLCCPNVTGISVKCCVVQMVTGISVKSCVVQMVTGISVLCCPNGHRDMC